MSTIHRPEADKRNTMPANKSEDLHRRILRLKIRIVTLATILGVLFGFLYWIFCHHAKRAHDEGDEGEMRVIDAKESDRAEKQDAAIRTVLLPISGCPLMMPTLTSLRSLWLLDTRMSGLGRAVVGRSGDRSAMTPGDPPQFTRRVARLEMSLLKERRKLPVRWCASTQATSSRAFSYAPIRCVGVTGRGPQ